MSGEPVILRENRGPVRLLTLNRPQVRNALSLSLMHDLLAALNEARLDSAVRAVVLTGAGSAFCAGLDMDELRGMAGRTSEQHRADSEVFRSLLEALYLFPKPVVAAVQGHAVAGGAGLAAVCDLTVMADSAKMGFTEARIGFVAALVTAFIVRLVGEKHARDLLLSARLLSADEARQMGLVNEVAPAADVLERALTRAQEMTRSAPGSVAMTKGMIAAAPGMGLGEGLRYAADLNALARSGAELREGVAAFLEKRDPAWIVALEESS
ncbi:enoyl-CoA hydratase/isomerase family protein [Deinococcus metallilatus]|uniref:Methylglutaconyl-CoA hydratase n=1 Tax=Deinococcus metallilatus TaxID=1211322 RepID=A0ABR6MN66_9DEIO|nr:enoyl-CoA hydratase/isomerase family protein [Deinococcus metallilatus]MBB5293377.1 methylglutaconyl-CoA hydratase [Deinococcus metallilatus]GMA15400.1 enoyl-CoA hydratase [Deinococcus metallilatus]